MDINDQIQVCLCEFVEFLQASTKRKAISIRDKLVVKLSWLLSSEQLDNDQKSKCETNYIHLLRDKLIDLFTKYSAQEAKTKYNEWLVSSGQNTDEYEYVSYCEPQDILILSKRDPIYFRINNLHNLFTKIKDLSMPSNKKLRSEYLKLGLDLYEDLIRVGVYKYSWDTPMYYRFSAYEIFASIDYLLYTIYAEIRNMVFDSSVAYRLFVQENYHYLYNFCERFDGESIRHQLPCHFYPCFEFDDAHFICHDCDSLESFYINTSFV